VRSMRVSLAIASLAFSTVVATPVLAGPIVGEKFSLDTYVGSGTPAAGPWGTVTLTQAGTSVNVSVALTAPAVGFVKTGAGDALFFNLDGISSISVSDLTSGFSFESLTSGNIHSGGAGSWDFGVACGGACGSGGSSPAPGPLSFSIADVTLDDFIPNDNGYFFSSDLCIGLKSGKCVVTGNAVSDHDDAISVPEPGTLALFGAGLAGIIVRKRRKAA
jgi:hypothetical protein